MTPDTARWLSSAYLVTGSVSMPVDRLSVPQGNRVLTFTSSNYATPQPVVLTVVRNREPGQLSDLSDTPLASKPPPPPPPRPPVHCRAKEAAVALANMQTLLRHFCIRTCFWYMSKQAVHAEIANVSFDRMEPV